MDRHPGMEQEDAVTAAAKAAASLAARAGGGEYENRVEVLKVDEALGLVFGWAMICTENGVPYFDSQDDHIPEASMLKAASDFMQNSRLLGDMHQKAEGGSVVFAFPMTADIAKAYGLTTAKTGLMIAVKPATDEVMAKFKSGEYSGFSIGGRRIKDEDAE